MYIFKQAIKFFSIDLLGGREEVYNLQWDKAVYIFNTFSVKTYTQTYMNL